MLFTFFVCVLLLISLIKMSFKCNAEMKCNVHESKKDTMCLTEKMHKLGKLSSAMSYVVL